MQPYMQPYIDFAQNAYGSCRAYSCVQNIDRWLKSHFEYAFNNWYCFMVRRGYDGHMSVIFDIGLVVADVKARFEREDDFSGFLNKLKRSDQMTEVIRPMLDKAGVKKRPRIEIGLIESILSEMEWEEDPGLDSPEILPILVKDKEKTLLRVPGDPSMQPIHWNESRPSAKSRFDPAHNKDGDSFGKTIASPAQLIASYLGATFPEITSTLDFEVLDACLRAGNLPDQDREPPPTSRASENDRTKSIKPGNIGGVTGARPKLPPDPLSEILANELALVKKDQDAGLWHIICGKPLVWQHETERDRIPQHNLLVGFYVDACDANAAIDLESKAKVHRYRHKYVYAKQLVFDAIRDLRQVREILKGRVELFIDSAMFLMSPGSKEVESAVQFPIDEIRHARGDDRQTARFFQILDFCDIFPDFFSRYPGRSMGGSTDPSTFGILPNVDDHLKKQAKDGEYTTIFLVFIGLENMFQMVSVVNKIFRFEPSAAYKLLLVDIDMEEYDRFLKSVDINQPGWRFNHARTMDEASKLISSGLSRNSRISVRKHLLDLIIGETVK